MQIFRTASNYWLLSRHCSAAWTGTDRCIRLYASRYDLASMKPSNGHGLLVYVQELMQSSTKFYGIHRHLLPLVV